MVQIDLLFKLAGLGVVVAVLCQVLTRAGREELSTLVTWSMPASSSAIFASAPGSPRGTSSTRAFDSPNSSFIATVSRP